jgi:uncharacterized protein with ATP-grasp and redox domains
MARRVTRDPGRHGDLVADSLAMLGKADLSMPPPVLAGRVQALMAQRSGVSDPYHASKQWSNGLAERLLKNSLAGMPEGSVPFETACRYAIAGNVIDFGVRSDLHEEMVLEALELALSEPLTAAAVAEFRQAVSDAESILYLLDNAGEIVFDRVLLRQLPLERVTIAVKGAPALNDATRDDAGHAGIDELATVVDNGSAFPGTVLDACSAEFRIAFANAGLVVAKGQANYETLGDVPGYFAFLLKVKCPQVAADVGSPVGTHVLEMRRNR